MEPHLNHDSFQKIPFDTIICFVHINFQGKLKLGFNLPKLQKMKNLMCYQNIVLNKSTFHKGVLVRRDDFGSHPFNRLANSILHLFQCHRTREMGIHFIANNRLNTIEHIPPIP
ncbi:hypothetical protein ACFX1Q_010015 [Malus domestica]